MTIVSSPNPISIQDVYNEFGTAAIAGSPLASVSHSLNEFYSLGNKTSYFTGRTVTSTPNSSTISLNDFYGKSRDLQFNFLGAKSNWIDAYPNPFTFSNLGTVPGGNLNRWYIVILSRYQGSFLKNVTMGFDGTAQRFADHTAAFTYTVTNKSGTSIVDRHATVSVWLYKKQTGGSLSIVTNNNEEYHMCVFEVYTTHNMESSKKTFYSGTSDPSVSFTFTPVVGSIFIQAATNDDNSNGALLQGAWTSVSFGTEVLGAFTQTSGPQGNGFYNRQMMRDGSTSSRSRWAVTAGTFFENTTTRTFTMTDPRSRSGSSQNVSAGLYIAP